MVSRALGSRLPKKPDDPAPNLEDVLTNLDVSEREAPAYPIHRIEFAEAAPSQPARATANGMPAELEAHRQRLEQLLQNARQIEEMLAKEAAQARALGENLKLEEKRAAVAEAAELEQRAAGEAQAYTKNSDTAAAFQAKIEAELATARQELVGAEASVAELQSRLRDAQDRVALSKSKMIECESKSKEAAKRAELAKGLANDAECRVAKCREAREAAEAEAHQAEEIASSIALTAQTLKRIRELGQGV
jgi:chromosome segregation ATPase